MFVGPHHSSKEVWVIDAMDPRTNEFDEHKVCLGFETSRDAIASFKKCYDDGAARRIGAITHLSMDSLQWKEFLANGDKRLPFARELLAA